MSCNKLDIQNQKDIPFLNTKKGKITLYSVITLLTILYLFIPSISFAFVPEGGFPIFEPGKIPLWLCALINGNIMEWINGQFYSAMTSIMNISLDQTGLTADWGSLLGSGSQFHDILVNISNVAVKPIAGTLLSCVFLMQFIKLTSKADGNATLPFFKDIIFLMVLLVLFTMLISHSDDICGMIYSEINKISKAIQGGTIPKPNVTQDFIWPNVQDDTGWKSWENFNCNFGALMFIWLGMLIFGIIGFAASIVVTVMVLGRALQLYVMSAFSPIPFSMLGFDETKQWGIGFFKNFASIALAGTILLVILFATPYFVTAALGGTDVGSTIMYTKQLSSGNLGDDFSTGVSIIAKCLACGIIIIVSAIKSGSWAKEIMGS